MQLLERHKTSVPYFAKYRYRTPPFYKKISKQKQAAWQFFAAISLFLGIVYLHWRLSASFNSEAPIFSALVLFAEILAFAGLLLFYFDIWAERDTEIVAAPSKAKEIGVKSNGNIKVDVFITTFDEPPAVLHPSITSALKVRAPKNAEVFVHVLDDGARYEVENTCNQLGVSYLTRPDNRGFKAGNLREAMLKTQGELIVICDADTCLQPTFLENTMGYFRDQNVSWVQTPHWFYDIPEGRNKNRYWLSKFPALARPIALVRRNLRISKTSADDPFMNSPDFFFDIIQRRRNRNSASFCCGAGSIHRRAALLEVAMQDQSEKLTKLCNELPNGLSNNTNSALRVTEALPFEYHVSEDIFTSIRHHRRGWKSVYHPQVEALMLSPRTISSWALQRMKYAGGTYDIFRCSNPLLMRSIPWSVRLHYLSTFWSYLSVLWLPVLLLSPAVSLLTGWSPVNAYSLEFFQHLLPFLLAHELAVSIAAKGHDINLGRSMNIGLVPLHIKAAWNVICGRKPTFLPTPKIPLQNTGGHLLMPHVVTLCFFVVAAVVGTYRLFTNDPNFSTAFVATNMLWLCWNVAVLWRTLRILFWRDRSEDNKKFKLVGRIASEH